MGDDSLAEYAPPVAPEGEVTILDYPSFVADCMSHWNPIARPGWELGGHLLTRNETWGDILRVDFRIHGDDLSPLVNRFICWRDHDGEFAVMLAIGQNVAPLLRRYWFRFEDVPKPTALNLGCGVTAYTLDDALHLLTQRVFERVGTLKIVEGIEDVSLDQIEQNHARPNIGNLFERGIWFPQGY